MRALFSDEFEANGCTHRAGRIAVEQQALIMKRLVPFLAIFTALAKRVREQAAATPAAKPADGVEAALSSEAGESRVPKADPTVLIEVVREFGECCSRMSDADYKFVLYTCLAAVKRKVGETWRPVSHGEHLLFTADEDETAIDLPGMMQMAGTAFWFNCESFFGALPSSSKEAIQQAKDQLLG